MLSNLHLNILSANHGDFDSFIRETRLQNLEKSSFTFDEYKQWLLAKEKNHPKNKKNPFNVESGEFSDNERNPKSWLKSPVEKALLLNRYEGHRWSQMFLRCSFLDESSFCSASEDGFLCVWNLNQAKPIQKQKVSDFVLNDVAVKRIEDKNGDSVSLNGENGNDLWKVSQKVLTAIC